LTTLPGVGGKVADCVLLFGCGHASAFPVDVWVARLLRDWFGLEDASREALSRRGRALLGEHAGLMQQFLFHAARVGAMEVGD
jgi:N-glycosylase/DNA lyase